MMKKLIQKFKLYRYKEIVLVDSENVGYLVPSKIPNHVYVYMFVSDPFVLMKLQDQQLPKNIHLEDISRIRNQNSSKDIMDYCIMIKLTEIISFINHRHKLMICSRDKGYDAAIAFLKKEKITHHIERYSGSLANLYSENKDFVSILEKMNNDTCIQFKKYTNIASLKNAISKKQKEIFIIEKYIHDISYVSTYIEFDVYQLSYHVYFSGNLIHQTTQKEDALQIFHQQVIKIREKYDKYQTHELFVKATELHIRQYIEEAYLKKQSLQQCLVDHLGESHGQELYYRYTN